MDASRLLRPLCRAQLAGRSCRPLPETRGRGGAGPHRGLPGGGARGAGGVRRGAGGRGRASRGGREGRGKALIMFRGKGSLPAREPGARRRPRRSPPLGSRLDFPHLTAPRRSLLSAVRCLSEWKHTDQLQVSVYRNRVKEKEKGWESRDKY